MQRTKHTLFVAALGAALAAGATGCFSLFPMPGTGGKKDSGPKKPMHVGGRVFGSGTTQVPGWDVALGVAPEIAVVSDNKFSLKVTNFRTDGDTMAHGVYALYVRVRRPSDGANEHLLPQTGIVTDTDWQLGQRVVEHGAATWMGFAVQRYSLLDTENKGAFNRAVVTGIHGNCIWQLIVGHDDAARMEVMLDEGLASVKGIAGATPAPAACQ